MTTTLYGHWRDVPKDAWRWRNFSRAEIACRGTGKILIRHRHPVPAQPAPRW
ncbi:hypothetical protein [Oceaniovalibus sp. ACAM 378]|uniref:hypothetical protein n=1 Tax=Oceaniovalibus sp. ACAM 378 TaxID=2599923 RepID=UPI0021085F2B|nr:hypothetical protein [Oceaniovalibus sp. ACAM 378]